MYIYIYKYMKKKQRQTRQRQRNAGSPKSKKSPLECSICIESIRPQDLAREKCSSKHPFHKECMEKLLTTTRNAKCPNCRGNFALPLEQHVKRAYTIINEKISGTQDEQLDKVERAQGTLDKFKEILSDKIIRKEIHIFVDDNTSLVQLITQECLPFTKQLYNYIKDPHTLKADVRKAIDHKNVNSVFEFTDNIDKNIDYLNEIMEFAFNNLPRIISIILDKIKYIKLAKLDSMCVKILSDMDTIKQTELVKKIKNKASDCIDIFKKLEYYDSPEKVRETIPTSGLAIFVELLNDINVFGENISNITENIKSESSLRTSAASKIQSSYRTKTRRASGKRTKRTKRIKKTKRRKITK